jgi:hypothetical protein
MSNRRSIDSGEGEGELVSRWQATHATTRRGTNRGRLPSSRSVPVGIRNIGPDDTGVAVGSRGSVDRSRREPSAENRGISEFAARGVPLLTSIR